MKYLLFSWVITKVKGIALVEVSLTISHAYLAILIAEHFLHVSGVMAVVTASLVIGSHGRTSISGHGWELLQETWETLGFWANSLIFVLVGIAVPTILAVFGPEMWITLGTILMVGFGARALLTHGILPVLSATGICPPVNLGFRTVMWWGGLRGAVSLALALAFFENEAISQENQNFVIALVCAFVLFTLFFRYSFGLFLVLVCSPFCLSSVFFRFTSGLRSVYVRSVWSASFGRCSVFVKSTFGLLSDCVRVSVRSAFGIRPS